MYPCTNTQQITTFLNHVGYSSLYFVIGSLSRPGPVQEAFQQLLTALGPSTQQQLAVLDFKGLCHILTAYASTEHVPKSIHLERLLAEVWLCFGGVCALVFLGMHWCFCACTATCAIVHTPLLHSLHATHTGS